MFILPEILSPFTLPEELLYMGMRELRYGRKWERGMCAGMIARREE